MNDGRQRFSQVVRKAGTVIVHGHHSVDVPALGGEPEGHFGRAGVRLLVSQVSGADGLYAIDVTSTQARAMLEGFLETGAIIGRRLSWSSRGYGRRRRDTLRING